MPAAATPHMEYADFGAWYDTYRSTTLEPALEAASQALDELLNDVLSTRDRTRIRRSSGRIKSKRRAWRKLQRERRDHPSAAAADIPGLIHDLVGLRITCTNVRDIDMVQAALDTLPRAGSQSNKTTRSLLRLDSGSERDYVNEPKESGYRGWHVNLTIDIDQDANLVPVRFELQVRTLLQDSWGELTHEDTYSKDGELPPLVEVLSRRMSDLFATLDDIAEDLRTELDRIDEAAVADAATKGPSSAEDLNAAGQAADAASVLRDRWGRLDRPTSLAALAWELQTEFGAEISDEWFGYDSFKQFLTTALPNAEFSTGRQAYLLPAEQAAPTADEEDSPGIPETAEALRRADPGFPLLQTEQWQALYLHLADAWRTVGSVSPSSKRTVNRLTSAARDRSQHAGEPLARRHFDFVAKALLGDEQLDGAPGAEKIASGFAAITLQRMADLRILGERNRKGRARVRQWMAATESNTATQK